MRNLPAVSIVFLAVAAAAALGNKIASPEEGALIEEKDAKALFVEVHKCNRCHGVKAAEIENKAKRKSLKGPDLSGYKSDLSVADLASFLRRESQMEGKKHRLKFKGTDEELMAIVDWLGSLEAQEP